MPELRERPGSPFTAAGSNSATVDPVPTIRQKELRNEIGEILRRAEAGEEFTITVSGRPVARLSPLRPRQWVPSEQLEELWKLPVDPTFLRDIEDFDFDIGNPWED